MKNFIFFFLVSISFSGLAQTLTLRKGTTRAVVIGVADYLDDGIPDLRFSDKDAQAFAGYLQSEAGGNLPNENIMLLTNEEATTGQMYAALDWLIEESQPGDQAVIYFSGHGDVETVTRRQRGFLLTHDSPPNNYRAGAYAIVFLQDVIETLSLDKETQVIMVSDACRAGKLAGSKINGTQATSAAMSQQFANEIKILSCQPEEFSLEGEQWGGGRGCFSYHLLDGLYGMADRNEDFSVNLMELERYLEDNVTTEAAPHSQIPMAVGKKSAVIATVNQSALAELKKSKETNQEVFAATKTRGIEDMILAKTDSTIQELYGKFLAAIDDGNLMKPVGASANDYYEILSKEEELKKLHGYMRRNFAATLQDQSQKALLDLLNSTEKYLDEYIYSKKKSVEDFSDHLNRAAELLGENHYLFNSLKARALYFESLALSEKFKDLEADSIKKLMIEKLEQGINYDESAAYIYKVLGDCYYHIDSSKMKNYYEKALELAPNWAFGHLGYAANLHYMANFEKAIFNFEKALEIDSSLLIVYQGLSYCYTNTSQWQKRKETLNSAKAKIEQAIAQNPDGIYPYYYYQLGEIYWMLGENFERAERVLKIACEKIGEQLPRTYTILGEIYRKQKKYDLALSSYQEAMKPLGADKSEPTAYIAYMYEFDLKDYATAEQFYIESLNYLNPNDLAIKSYKMYNIGRLNYQHLNNCTKAIDYLEQSVALNSVYGPAYFHLGKAYFDCGDTLKAEKYLKLAIEKNQNNAHYSLGLHDFYYKTNRKDSASTLVKEYLEEERMTYDYYKVGELLINNKEIEFAEEIIQESLEKHPEDNVADYNAACLYSIAEMPQKALYQLELSLQKGYSNLAHIKQNTDLDNIRDTKEFKDLIKKYFPNEGK